MGLRPSSIRGHRTRRLPAPLQSFPRRRESTRYVSASEAKQRLAALLDAAQREPVTIRRQNRDIAVVISCTDYRHLTGGNVEAFRQFCNRISEAAKARGMTEDKLDRLLGD